MENLPRNIRNFEDLPRASVLIKDDADRLGFKNYQDKFALLQVPDEAPSAPDSVPVASPAPAPASSKSAPRASGHSSSHSSGSNPSSSAGADLANTVNIWVLAVSGFINTVPYHGILKKISNRNSAAGMTDLDADGNPPKIYRIQHTATIEPPLLRALYEKEESQSAPLQNNSELTNYLDKILTVALKEHISDIHIEKRPTKSRIRMRKHGQLMDYEGISSSFATNLCSVIYNVLGENRDIQYSEEDFQACAISRVVNNEEVKLRYQSLPVYPNGFDVVLRVLPIGGSEEEEFVSMQELGYTDSQVKTLLDIVSRPVGALVIAGTTGSGKSTTLKNLLMFVNASRGYKSKFYTIEDPPEYRIPLVSQIPVIRRKKDEEKNLLKSPFEAPLTAAMRGDPDVLMLGEVRDDFTGDGLKKATQSGHQVMTTVHAASSLGIVERLADFTISASVMGSPEFLTGLIYQKLVPLVCQTCAVDFRTILEGATASPADLELAHRLNKVADLDKDTIKISGHDKNCPSCHGMGISGRTVCAEIIAPDFNMLKFFRAQDMVGAYAYWRSLSDQDRDSSDMTGKPAIEHALFKMRKGLVSPMDVEHLFGHLDTALKLFAQSQGFRSQEQGGGNPAPGTSGTASGSAGASGAPGSTTDSPGFQFH